MAGEPQLVREGRQIDPGLEHGVEGGGQAQASLVLMDRHPGLAPEDARQVSGRSADAPRNVLEPQALPIVLLDQLAGAGDHAPMTLARLETPRRAAAAGGAGHRRARDRDQLLLELELRRPLLLGVLERADQPPEAQVDTERREQGPRSRFAVPREAIELGPELVLESDVAAPAVGDGALDRGWPGGIRLADVDGDGDLDLMATRGYDVTNRQKDAFYRNLGEGVLVREELGDATATPGSNFSSTWVDIDGDGDLDLYVGGPMLSRAEPNLVYRNDDGDFVRVTGTPIENGRSNAGAVLWADLDSDGDQDLFVANSDILRRNDIEPAEIETPADYRNDGDWRFTRLGPQSFDRPEHSANDAALGDVDVDGDLDLFLGLFSDEKSPVRDRLFLNDGNGIFSEAPGFRPAEHVQLATGAAFADLDLDGDLDLVFTSYGSGINVQLNDGQGRFTALEDPVLVARKGFHWSIATGDLDGDGDLDAVIGNWGEVAAGEHATLMRNEGPRCGDWIHIGLVDRAGAPDPPGARVTLIMRTPSGASTSEGAERRRLRKSSAQTTVRGQSASFFLFGVPKDETVVRAEVRWPDGTTQIVERLPRNGRLEVRAESTKER